MLPDRVLNPGPLTYESSAQPIALHGPAFNVVGKKTKHGSLKQTEKSQPSGQWIMPENEVNLFSNIIH